MAAEIILDGLQANSWVSLTDANIILAGSYHPVFGAGFQLEASHIPHLLTAARMIGDNWWFKGSAVAEEQLLAWPRKDVPKPSKALSPATIDAHFPYLTDEQRALAYEIHLWNPGLLSPETLPEGTPADVKRAQAYLAAFLVKGVTLWDDTKYNADKVKLGSIELTGTKNAVAKADIVFQALAKLGTFKGATTARAGGGR